MLSQVTGQACQVTFHGTLMPEDNGAASLVHHHSTIIVMLKLEANGMASHSMLKLEADGTASQAMLTPEADILDLFSLIIENKLIHVYLL